MSTDSLSFYLSKLEPFLSSTDTRDLCINPNGSVFVDSSAGWREVQLPDLDPNHIVSLGNNIANYLRLPLGEKHPTVGGTAPTGHRVQVVVSPTLEHGVSITMRRPSDDVWTIQDLAEKGMFDQVAALSDQRHGHDALLAACEAARTHGSPTKWTTFFRLLAESKLNVIFSGPMGSGKTTLAKACMEHIPAAERLLTLEDAREIFTKNRRNVVHLLYQRESVNGYGLTASQVLNVSLRMKGSRICLSELRGEETYDYLAMAFGAHPGSMSTTHGNSALEAYRRLSLLCMESPKGRALGYSQIEELVRLAVDVVIQTDSRYIEGLGVKPFVKEIFFSPRITQ